MEEKYSSEIWRKTSVVIYELLEKVINPGEFRLSHSKPHSQYCSKSISNLCVETQLSTLIL